MTAASAVATALPAPTLLLPALLAYYENMAGKKRTTKKKRGRPATGQDPVTAIRLPPEMLATLDLMRPAYPDAKNRSEFIRELVTEALNDLIRRQQRRAHDYVMRTDLRAGPFTVEKEQAITDFIKRRMLYEGACNLQWPEYFAFRDKHDSCEPLTDSDLTYAAAYSSCRPKARRKK